MRTPDLNLFLNSKGDEELLLLVEQSEPCTEQTLTLLLIHVIRCRPSLEGRYYSMIHYLWGGTINNPSHRPALLHPQEFMWCWVKGKATQGLLISFFSSLRFLFLLYYLSYSSSSPHAFLYAEFVFYFFSLFFQMHRFRKI